MTLEEIQEAIHSPAVGFLYSNENVKSVKKKKKGGQ